MPSSLNEVLRGGVEAVVGNDSVEVGAGVLAGEDQSVVVRCLDADTGSQHILVGHVSSSVALVLGQVVVLGSAHDGLRRHGGVEGLVLEGVQDPLKTHEEVLGGQVRLDLAVDVAPIDIVAQVEGPDGGVVVVLPAGCDGGHCLAVAVEAHQAVPQVGDDVGVGEGLAVQHVPALDLTVGRLPGDVLLEGGGTGGVGGLCAGSSRAAGVVGLAAAAGGQQAGGTHDAGAFRKLRRVMLRDSKSMFIEIRSSEILFSFFPILNAKNGTLRVPKRTKRPGPHLSYSNIVGKRSQ